MLMTHDTTPNQVKRLAANMHRAAGRVRELLTDLTGVTYGNRSTPEICDIREIIASASEAAATAMENQRVQQTMASVRIFRRWLLRRVQEDSTLCVASILSLFTSCWPWSG
jgi:hypothetical protein